MLYKTTKVNGIHNAYQIRSDNNIQEQIAATARITVNNTSIKLMVGLCDFFHGKMQP